MATLWSGIFVRYIRATALASMRSNFWPATRKYIDRRWSLSGLGLVAVQKSSPENAITCCFQDNSWLWLIINTPEVVVPNFSTDSWGRECKIENITRKNEEIRWSGGKEPTLSPWFNLKGDNYTCIQLWRTCSSDSLNTWSVYVVWRRQCAPKAWGSDRLLLIRVFCTHTTTTKPQHKHEHRMESLKPFLGAVSQLLPPSDKELCFSSVTKRNLAEMGITLK